MKLLYSPTSPYARKIRVVAAEKRIDIRMETVVLSHPDCPVSLHNPLGKIPVLVLDDGEVPLKTGAVVIQRGTNHAWANRSGRMCRMLFVLVSGAYEPALAASLAER